MNIPQNPQNLLPIFLNSKSLNILIIGHGKNALHRLIEVLEEYQVNEIKIISTENSAEIKNIAEQYNFIKIFDKEIEESDFSNVKIAFVTSDRDNFFDLKKWAEKNSVLIHFNFHPNISDFQPGSSVDKGNLKVAFYADQVSSGINNKIKISFEKIIPDEISELLGNLKKIGENPQAEFRKKIYTLNKITRKISKGQNYVDPFSELETTSKIVKTARLKANLYLGIIGAMVFVGLFFLTLYEFELFPDVKLFLVQDNYIFLWMLLVGFLAEIVAGSMGMGYGVICTTILLMIGISPPIVSASIHSAESFTTAAGSISHYKLRNVNLKLVKRMAPFAILGAIIGAITLTYFGEHYAKIVKPIIALYTLVIGTNILRKSLKKTPIIKENRKRSNLTFLGLVGGFIDSFAGGGWGPLVTGSLIKDGRTPRYVVGSSTLTKFLLTITSAITFVYTMGIQHWNIVLGLLLGGVVTAPFSAMLTSRLPVKKMTIAISILVIVMSSITIVKSFLK